MGMGSMDLPPWLWMGDCIEELIAFEGLDEQVDDIRSFKGYVSCCMTEWKLICDVIKMNN